MKSFKFISAAALATICSVSQLSYADNLSVKADMGFAEALVKPQTNRFDPGAAISVKGLAEVHPNIDLGVGVSAIALASNISGIAMGTGYGFGGSVRVKESHTRMESAWVDTDMQFIRTGPLNRAAISIGAGIAFATTEEKNVWLGPFVRYQDIVQGVKTGFDNTDAHILIAGMSLELGKTHKETIVLDSDNDGTPDITDRCPYIPGPKDNFGCPVVVEEKAAAKIETPPEPTKTPTEPVVFKLKQRIQFPWDSYVIGAEAQYALGDVVAKLIDNVNYNVKIEGHASSEGTPEHNQTLSESRANAVMNFLIENGIDKSRLTATGFGSTIPFADNSTEDGREQNRRVEFTVVFTLEEKK